MTLSGHQLSSNPNFPPTAHDFLLLLPYIARSFPAIISGVCSVYPGRTVSLLGSDMSPLAVLPSAGDIGSKLDTGETGSGDKGPQLELSLIHI